MYSCHFSASNSLNEASVAGSLLIGLTSGPLVVQGMRKEFGSADLSIEESSGWIVGANST